LSATIERSLDERERLRTRRPQTFQEAALFSGTQHARIKLGRFVNHEDMQNVAAPPAGNEKPRA